MLATPSGTVSQHPPVVYQQVDGVRRAVEGSYVLLGPTRWASASAPRPRPVKVPAFTPGTTGPVVVTATKADQTKTTSWEFDVEDMAGNKRHCS